MSPQNRPLRRLEDTLGYTFQDTAVLEQALTHRSFVHEHPEAGSATNERLEFLGDAILHFSVADELYARFPDAPEGRLTALRATVVCTSSLAAIAESLDLATYLRVSRGEATIDGRGRQSILADGLEAVVAAVYQDGGLQQARNLVRRLVEPRIEAAAEEQGTANVKGRLQELIQAAEGVTPHYRVVERSGPVHAEQFVVEVVAGERVLGRGEGIGKRQAEHEAARLALDAMDTGEGETLEPAGSRTSDAAVSAKEDPAAG